MDGTLLGHMSLLLRQTILEVRKPEFGTALVRCCAKNKFWRPELAAMLDQCCTVSNFALGAFEKIYQFNAL